jgi:Clostridium P-47 protein
MAGTNGWDTVFAIRASQLNAEFAKPGASPANFTQTANTGLGPSTFAGDFGAWQIVPGGSGSKLRIDAPISGGTLTANGVSLSGIGGTVAMTATATAPSATAPAIGIASVVVDALNSPQLQQGSTEESLARTLVGDWLTAHVSDIALLFATVDVDQKVSMDPGLEWLAPSTARLAVADDPADNQPVVGILTTLAGTGATALSAVVEPSLIPTGKGAAFMIGPSAFLGRFIKPGVRVLFVGATDADFEVVQSGTELRNNTTLTFQDFKLKDGTVVTAKVPGGGFTVTLQGSQLKVRFEDVNFEWTPGVTAHYVFTAVHTAVLDEDGRIELIQGEQQLSANFSMSEGVIIGEVAAAIAEAAVFALVGYGVGRLLTPAEEPEVQLDDAGDNATVAPVTTTPTPGAGGIGDPANGLNPAGITTAVNEVKVATGEAPAAPTEGGGFWVRHAVKLKVIIWTFGTLAAVGSGMIAQFIEWAGQGRIGEQPPTLANFTSNAVKPIQWPVAGDFVPSSAQFADGLLIGGDVTP